MGQEPESCKLGAERGPAPQPWEPKGWRIGMVREWVSGNHYERGQWEKKVWEKVLWKRACLHVQFMWALAFSMEQIWDDMSCVSYATRFTTCIWSAKKVTAKKTQKTPNHFFAKTYFCSIVNCFKISLFWGWLVWLWCKERRKFCCVYMSDILVKLFPK